MQEKLFKLYGVDVGDVDEIPVGSNLEGNKFFLHNNMDDLYVLSCRDTNSGNDM